jgi:hypothetical protein
MTDGKEPMDTLDAIKALVAKFDQNKESYLRSTYNEAQVRTEFIDPLFEALGWDVTNRQGFAEAYKEVIHEDAVKIGSATKAPDYSFRIGGVRKFFVEAKKPSVDIHDDPSPAFQLRRYAWSAKLPLSVLTDFQEFAVYDCRVKPAESDKPSVGRLVYLKYTDYEARWDEVLSVFSKDGLLRGSFDKFAASNRVKKGTTEVDSAFLTEIENWRSIFARNIALRNPRLSQRELNFAVQRTIDRLIFLRICEDRGIEDYGKLLGHLNGENVYKRLCELFREADDRYNSGLFHFREEKGREEAPDGLTLSLSIDDKVLKDLIRGMYYPESPYEFSVLPADILGQVYEQFLGKVIRLTEGHQARVEDKPEVKKAGGVYYTPTYIVQYIVKNTVGKLLEGKTPKEAARLRIVDPACGSGSFLIGAYQLLLDWHRDWYVNDNAEKWTKGKSPPLYQSRANEHRLTAAERKRILLNNIYGVDIDPQAVEVTKLSLLLKVLEGENEQSLNQQLKLFHERALPDLENNIKCGNSLIGPDFYQQQQLPLLTDEDRYRINVFDWQAEFADVFENGGFDVVIGNPPYIRIQRIEHAEADYVFQQYEAPTSKIDLSLVFLEKGLRLAKKAGRVGFICTSQWMSADYGRNLRRMLSDGKLHRIVNFGSLPVFRNANTYPAILILSSSPAPALEVFRVTSREQLSLTGVEAISPSTLELDSLSDAPWTLGGLDLVGALKGNGKKWLPLREFGKAYIGCKTGLNEAFVLPRSEAKRLRLEKSVLFPYAYRGDEIVRYGEVEPDAVVIYPYREGNDGTPVLISEDELRREFPNVHAHLASFKVPLRERQDSRRLYATGADWYRHLRSGNFNHIRAEKLAFKGIAKRTTVARLPGDSAFDGARCPSVILENLRGHSECYLFGILNSRLSSAHLKGVCPPKLSGYIEFVARAVSELPISLINFADRAEKAAHDRIVILVGEMLELRRKQDDEGTPHEQEVVRRKLAATDAEIDRLVYELYGLTDDEIRLVEEDPQV